MKLNEAGFATEDFQATCYNYGPAWGEYTGSCEMQVKRGTGLPASSTLLPPPETGDCEVALWGGDAWRISEDHTHAPVYLKESGVQGTWGSYGPLPRELTKEPWPEGGIWSVDGWRVPDDYFNGKAEAEVREERARLLEAPLLRLSIFEQQERYGIPTTITSADATALAMYIQELRDVTLQRGFPRNVVWPRVPETQAEKDARLDREFEEAKAERVRKYKAGKVAEAQAALDALKQE